MRAVVVEIKDNKAAVLSDDGRVIAVSNKAYVVGQVIELKHSHLSLIRKLTVYGAAAAAVVVLSLGSWAYASPYTYVSVDVNPSIEYSVNRFDRVLSVKGVNDDGEEIIEKIEFKELKFQTIEKAVLATVDQITAAGYFTDDMVGGIVITTASEDEVKAEILAASLQQAVEDEVIHNDEDVIVEASSIGLERVEEAKQLGVTPGKLNLVEKLQASAADPASIDIKQWLNRPVKDIMKATKDNQSTASKSEVSDNIKDSDHEDRKEQSKENLEDAKAQSKEDRKDAKIQSKEDRKEQKEEKKAEESQSKTDKNSTSIKKNASNEANNKNHQTIDKSNSSNEKSKANEKKVKGSNSDQTNQGSENASSNTDKQKKQSSSVPEKEKKNKDVALTTEDNNSTDSSQAIEEQADGISNTKDQSKHDKIDSIKGGAASDAAQIPTDNRTDHSNDYTGSTNNATDNTNHTAGNSNNAADNSNHTAGNSNNAADNSNHTAGNSDNTIENSGNSNNAAENSGNSASDNESGKSNSNSGKSEGNK